MREWLAITFRLTQLTLFYIMNLKKMILSGGMLVFAAAVVVGGTGAFFSDTETSTGNVFTAGSVDITIDNLVHDYYSDGEQNPGPKPIFTREGISFTLDDLKPLDYGDVEYTLGNDTNDAIVCVMVEETGNAENGRIDPEREAGDTTGSLTNTDAGLGELQDFMSFDFDGQNGALADIAGQWFSVGDLDSGNTLGAAVGYCFGDYNNDGGCVETSNPTDVNVAQTDSMTADIIFKAVQKRNNPDFSCDDWNEEHAPVVTSVTPTNGEWDGNGSFVLGIDAQDEDGDLYKLEIDTASPGQDFSVYA